MIWKFLKHYYEPKCSPNTNNIVERENVGKEGNNLLVKVFGLGTYVKVEDTYAEMFLMLETSPE